MWHSATMTGTTPPARTCTDDRIAEEFLFVKGSPGAGGSVLMAMMPPSSRLADRVFTNEIGIDRAEDEEEEGGERKGRNGRRTRRTKAENGRVGIHEWSTV